MYLHFKSLLAPPALILAHLFSLKSSRNGDKLLDIYNDYEPAEQFCDTVNKCNIIIIETALL